MSTHDKLMLTTILLGAFEIVFQVVTVVLS